MMTEARPKAMDGYIRVSRRMGREGPGYISKDVQREAIQRWADYRHVRIAAWHEDEDESGGTQHRPGLREAMRRVEDGDTEGIACWRLNRFARNVSEALADVKRVQAAGGKLAFVEEDIDPTGPFGEFILTVLLAVAALELNNIKASWATAKARANDRGVKNSRAPFGYRRIRDGDDKGKLEIIPAEAEVIREVYEICDREDVPAAVAFLRQHAPKRTWTAFTVRRTLANRQYLGEVRYGDLVYQDEDLRIVSRVLFERVQRKLAERVKRRAKAAVYPLSSLATCATCGGTLVADRGGNDHRRMYRCGARTRKGPNCPDPVSLSADPLEQYVVQVLREAFQGPAFEIGGGDDNTEVDTAEAALADAEDELDAFASDLTARQLLGDHYHHHLRQRVDAVADAREHLHAAMDAIAPVEMIVPDELWDTLEPVELAEVLRGGLDTVVVGRGRGPLSERVRVVPKGTNGQPVTAA
jgi:DNA invertase Pin-like site-specific DNA recombinase